MYKLGIAALVAIAWGGAADATHFIFSDQMGSSVITGSFDGTLNGNLITGLSNVTVYINGLGPIGNGTLFPVGYDASTSTYVSNGAVASLDGTQNDFFFANADLGAGDFGYSAYFYSFAVFGWGDVAYDNLTDQNSSTGDINFRAQVSNSSDANTAVPEPACWAMMVAGFGLLGGVVRRERYRSRIKFS